MDYKVDKDTAQDELERWFKAWNMEFDEESFTQEERTDFDERIKSLIFTIRKGRLSFDDTENKLVYVLKTPVESSTTITEVKIPMPKGSNVMEMDSYKENQEIKKGYAIVASMIGKTVAFVGKMDSRDINFIGGINSLFLAS